MFAQLYLNLGEKISSIRLMGMSPEVYKEFSSAMKQVGGQFLTVSRQFDKQLDKALKDKEILVWDLVPIASSRASGESSVLIFHWVNYGQE